MTSDDINAGEMPMIRSLPSCLGWGGVAISSDGTQRGLDESEVLPVVIPLWAAMPEHEDEAVRLCTVFAQHRDPAVRQAALAALQTIASRRR